jgi:CheY-like chemotaxis protein
MPEMNGRELAEQLRQRHPALRLLLTSGFTEEVLLRQRLVEQGVAFVEKPYVLDVLAGKLRELLDAPTAGAA